MQTDRGKKWNEIRMRLFKMVSVGVVDDPINQGYDIVSTLMLIVNLIGAFANTFDGVRAQYASLLVLTEEITVAFFALDYALRLVTAKCLYPQLTEGRALAKYMLSAGGIVDLLSFLPFYLPFFFPSGAAAFRLFRVARIFRLFRINAYYDSLNVITEVIVGKKQQLLSSVFIILVLMLGSSLCMYSLEHDAQPEVFKNAFSGVWWSVSTLLTIGYGDIYPITPAGKRWAFSSRSSALAWWRSRPVSYPPASWSSTRASSVSATMPRKRICISSRPSCTAAISGSGRRCASCICRRA